MKRKTFSLFAICLLVFLFASICFLTSPEKAYAENLCEYTSPYNGVCMNPNPPNGDYVCCDILGDKDCHLGPPIWED